LTELLRRLETSNGSVVLRSPGKMFVEGGAARGGAAKTTFEI